MQWHLSILGLQFLDRKHGYFTCEAMSVLDVISIMTTQVVSPSVLCVDLLNLFCVGCVNVVASACQCLSIDSCRLSLHGFVCSPVLLY